LRVDASQGNGNTTDLKESGEVRPALLLMDLVSKAHGTFGSHKDCTKYFRRVSESVKHVTNEHCEALEAVDAEKKCVTDLKDEALRLTLAEDNSYSASNALSPVFMLAVMMLTVLSGAM